VLLAANFVSGRGLGASVAVKSVVAASIEVVDKDAPGKMPFLAEYAESHSGNPMKSWLVFQMLGVIVGGFLSGVLAGRLKLKVEHSPGITSRRRLSSRLPEASSLASVHSLAAAAQADQH
jgi:hypothetical protein